MNRRHEKSPDQSANNTQDILAAIRHEITQLKNAMNKHRKLEPHDLLRELADAIIEVENYISAIEISSYFSALETEENYALPKNDNNLFNFLNNRTPIQQDIDYRASCELVNAKFKIENSKLFITRRSIAKQTEKNYRIAFMIENHDHAANGPDGANRRRLNSLNAEIFRPLLFTAGQQMLTIFNRRTQTRAPAVKEEKHTRSLSRN